MSIETIKIDLAQRLLQTTNEQLIQKMQALFDAEDDWYDGLSEEEQREIDKGMAQLDNGEGISHETAQKEIGKWL